MRKSNPACLECPKSSSGVHHWKIEEDGCARCLSCKVKLNKADTYDLRN